MKRIIRTRTIEKTSRRLTTCHENFAATGETVEHAPVHCPHCGEPIQPALTTNAPPALTGGALEEAESRDGEN
jgi:hypothetical protein